MVRLFVHFLVILYLVTAPGLLFSRPDTLKIPEDNASAKSLDALCNVYKTDKCANLHNYIQVYERHFAPLRADARKVFEIGILSGASHRMWKSYFYNAAIYGIDILDCSYLESEGINTMIVDQADRAGLMGFIDRYGGGFDIIIDDGGHSMEQQQVSLGFLFSYLKPGGIYVIEDVHSSLRQYYQGFGVNETGSNTTFGLIVQYMATGNVNSEYMLPNEMDYLRLQIDVCELVYITTSMHSMMCIIRKK